MSHEDLDSNVHLPIIHKTLKLEITRVPRRVIINETVAWPTMESYLAMKETIPEPSAEADEVKCCSGPLK